MAPKTRRSSYSRRAQYGTFTGYVVAATGAVIGAVLLGLSLWQPGSFSGPRNLAADAIVQPVGESGAIVRTSGQTFFGSISGYFAAGRQNARLKEEAQLARIRLAEAESVAQENKRLKTLLGLAGADEKPVAVTRMIGSSSTSSRRFAYIGAGSREGVAVGMPVRGPRGVVGRVLEVAANTSRILLLTDSQSILPVRLSDQDVVAFAEGRGDGLLQIRLINLGINPLKKNDMLVTSGSGGYYKPGTAVAIVTKVTDDGALARMISDPAATNFVTVEPIWLPEVIESAQQPADAPLAQ